MKIRFQWVVFDAFYGRDLGLLRELERISVIFMAQIPESHNVFLKDFELKIPKQKSVRGRKARKPKPTRTPISIKEYVKTLGSADWTKLTVRTASNGLLKSYYHRIPVWLFDEQSLTKSKFTLINSTAIIFLVC